MDRLEKMIADALLELSSEAQKIENAQDHQDFFYKYDASFADDNLNSIDSEMLLHSLSYYFDFHLIEEQLHEILPWVCEKIDLKCEAICDTEGNVRYYIVYLF